MPAVFLAVSDLHLLSRDEKAKGISPGKEAWPTIPEDHWVAVQQGFEF